MVKSVKKEIGAECAELGGFLENPRVHVNAFARQLNQSEQKLRNMVQ
ncbi:hypothetical protein IC762_20235 [Bradyrhizobium genosp. L]|nr:hypothetical protein [Bradyrhizobium genosp. L]QPF82107.1 hypothetical protein IC762_20235 [Bradyrhizobium genosp. L]